MDFYAKFLQYQKNVYPKMIEHLAGNLGVTVESINRLGIGFYPAWQSWVWAERDDQGEIVGLIHRYSNGKKRMEEGSKRGLVYVCSSNIKNKTNDIHNYKFTRAYSAGVDCPLCGKRDWCLVAGSDLSRPTSVICGRIEKGSIRYIEGAGYLHQLQTPSRYTKTGVRSMLLSSPYSYLVVEGVTDVLAAMDMGYTAIGRPSAEGRTNWVASLLKGQDVIVIGENDEAGRRGMQKTFQVLKAYCSSVRKILPPAQYKDLRAWYPTADEFELWIRKNKITKTAEGIFETFRPDVLAQEWLKKVPQFGYFQDEWFNLE